MCVFSSKLNEIFNQVKIYSLKCFLKDIAFIEKFHMPLALRSLIGILNFENIFVNIYFSTNFAHGYLELKNI